VPPIRGRRGRPRRRPRELFADRGYDHDKYRRQLRARGITPRIARRGIAHGSGLGKQRWVVERGVAWLHAFNDFAPATNGEPTSTSAYSSSPAPSSATGSCLSF
jgi:transposase